MNTPDPLDSFAAVQAFFESLGYRVLDRPSPEDNDCDMYVVGNKRAAKVEIKKLQIKTNGVWQVPAVTPNQRTVDICAVVLPNGSVQVERMADYLAASSPEGYRSFTWLKL